MQRIMESFEYLIEVQDPKFFAISLTIAFRREREDFLEGHGSLSVFFVALLPEPSCSWIVTTFI